ncbi:unnamed protein product [Somion occarium]|uniref:Activator of Hsp90 ATPase AHSA1-like N-terminal domain-containing protein n=1 Tax=Somion occarium TaxID=3059160 RepID=A0ABP1DCU4_9APHY
MATIPPSMAPSTANWHWKNKTVTPWAKAWFERELVTLSIKGEGSEEAGVSEVVDFEGDAELGQRKLLTIYDCRVGLKWKGTASDGTEVEGKVTIPEVSHENAIDGISSYIYEWSLTTPSTPTVEALFNLVKARLPVALETKFAEFPSAIIETHGKDLTVSADTSRTGTPAPPTSNIPVASGASLATIAAAAAKPAPRTETKKLNTTTVSVDANFMASADDLFSILTDEKRIPAWSRAPAKSNPQPGAEYSLFGGGVKGKYISLNPPKEIKQTWALESPTWPTGHFATLTTTFDQSSDSTKVTWSLEGVPTGFEDEITRNLQGYYVHGLKSIGLGSEL